MCLLDASGSTDYGWNACLLKQSGFGAVTYGMGAVGMAAMQEQLYRSGVHLPFSGIVLVLLTSIVGAIILALLTALGGIIGVAIFEKRRDGAIPPPPQNYA